MMVLATCLAVLAAVWMLAKSFHWFFSGPTDLAHSTGYNLLPVFVHTENERVMEHLNSAARLGLWLGLGVSVGAFVLVVVGLVAATFGRFWG